MKWLSRINSLSLLTVLAFCLFGLELRNESSVFRGFEAALLSIQWTLMACLVVWFGAVIIFRFSFKDVWLLGLILVVIADFVYSPSLDAITMLTGVVLGKCAAIILKKRVYNDKYSNQPNAVERQGAEGRFESSLQTSELQSFLAGLVLLLMFASLWNLHSTKELYHGRWMGIWNNPNVYGLLMGVGLALAVGLLLTDTVSRVGGDLGTREWRGALKSDNAKVMSFSPKLRIVLLIAAVWNGIGLIFSYSRGAWAGTAISLLYLSKKYGNIRRWRIAASTVTVIMVICIFWKATPVSAPWYIQRLDLSRPSVQHRVAAWRAGILMMWNHPLGVGWNKAVAIYRRNYSPPADGAGALITNDYLMLGVQLGVPGLLCFLAYVILCLGGRSSKLKMSRRKIEKDRVQAVCRVGTLVMLVAFWFDGGLFKLATDAVFWVLLELGSMDKRMWLPQSLCVSRETCGAAMVMEHNGDVYSCDHYVYPEYRLGNILQEPLSSLANSSRQEHFGQDKRRRLPRQCRECEVRFACNGECPKHRFLRTPDGEPGLNYLCADYKLFFGDIDPYVRFMAHEVACARPHANVMQWMLPPGRRNPPVRIKRIQHEYRNDKNEDGINTAS